MNRIAKAALALVILTGLALAQGPPSQTRIQVQNAGSNVFFGSGYFKMNWTGAG